MKDNKKQLKSIFILWLAMPSSTTLFKVVLLGMGILVVSFFMSITAGAVFPISLDNIQISDSLGKAVNPDIVWSGSNYGLIWSDSRRGGELEIYFARLNELGDKVATELKISSNSDKISNYPAIIWAGNNYAVVWSEYSSDENGNKQGCGLNFTRIDKNGKVHGGIISVTSDNYGTCPNKPAIVWTGSAYGISWHETRLGNKTPRVFFTKLNPLGEGEDKDIPVSDALNSENASIIWTGSEYGLVWQADGAIYFVRLDANGVKWGDEIKLNTVSATSSEPVIAWHDSNYAVSWQGYDSNGTQQIYFAKVDHNGKKQKDEIALTSNKDKDYSVSPSIIWGNSEYGIAWQQGNGVIDFVSVDVDGDRKSKILQISSGENGQATQPVVALGTSQYAFAWRDTRAGGNEIYFAKAGFSDVAKNSQQSLLAFIEAINGSSWLIIVLILIVIIILWVVISRSKRK